MIDIHSHILPGFDDGASDWPTAVKMCRLAARDGVQGIVATPHFFRGLFPTPSVASVHEAVVELQQLCEKSLIPGLQIYLGADCHLHPEVLANVKSGRVPTLNGSHYLLLEIPDGPLPHRIKDVFFELAVAGITPIITHPERNELLRSHPSILHDFLLGGAYAQVTASSLLGAFGSSARAAAEFMVANHLVQIIASDGHDPEKRPILLSDAVDAAADIVGRDVAEAMVDNVPRAVLEDKPVRFPEPVLPEPKKTKKPLWRRMLEG